MSLDAQRDGGANQKTVGTGGFDPPRGTDVHVRNYDVHASHTVETRCDRLQRDRAQCDVGGQPDQTAMIEVGNGAVSITQGSY